jgi:hypothetical protein
MIRAFSAILREDGVAPGLAFDLLKDGDWDYEYTVKKHKNGQNQLRQKKPKLYTLKNKFDRGDRDNEELALYYLDVTYF